MSYVSRAYVVHVYFQHICVYVFGWGAMPQHLQHNNNTLQTARRDPPAQTQVPACMRKHACERRQLIY